MGKSRPWALWLAAVAWLLLQAAGAAASCTAGKLSICSANACYPVWGRSAGAEHHPWQADGGAAAAGSAGGEIAQKRRGATFRTS